MELEGEDVFVVSNGDDGLEDKNAGSCYSSVAGAVVGMFPRMPSSISWQQITFGSLSGFSELVLCQPSKYLMSQAVAT